MTQRKSALPALIGPAWLWLALFFVLDASAADKPARAEAGAVGVRVYLLPDAAGVSAGWRF